MKVRYNGESITLAHKGAGAQGQFGIDGSFYMFNAGQWLEVTNPVDVEFYKTVSRSENSDFEIEKTEAVADKIKETVSKTVDKIVDAVKGKPAESPAPKQAEKSTKGTLSMKDLKKARMGGE